MNYFKFIKQIFAFVLVIALLVPVGCTSQNVDYTSYDDCDLTVGNWITDVHINGATLHEEGEGGTYLYNKLYTLENDGEPYGNDSITIEGWMGFEKKVKKLGYAIDGGDPVYSGTFETVEELYADPAGKYGISFSVTVDLEGVTGEHKINIVAKLSGGTVVIFDGEYKDATMRSFLPHEGNIITTITYIGAEAEDVAPETQYTVRSRWEDKDTAMLDTDDLEEAKAAADKNLRLGYGVFDKEGNLVYAPVSEAAMRILREANWVADYCKANGFTYGDAPINPAIDCTAKLFSCDRLVCWSLYRAGWSDMPYEKGLFVTDSSHERDLSDFLEEHNFTKITDYTELQPGDVVLTWNDPETQSYKGHTFIFAGWVSEVGGADYRYDGGSDYRIQQSQPYVESCGDIAYKFAYAYRAN